MTTDPTNVPTTVPTNDPKKVSHGRALEPSDHSFLADLLNRKYENYLLGKLFAVDSHFVANEQGVYVQVTLANADQSFYYPVEARVNIDAEELGKKDAAFFLVDYIDTYFEEYLMEEEDLFLPIDWSPQEYDAVSFQMRGQIRNLKLEKMADEWLG